MMGRIVKAAALRDVLAKVGVPLGDALRGKALARAILATAADGRPDGSGR